MMLAHMAGIKVFGTGGLGGVHRGGELSMDISGAYDDNKSVSRSIANKTSGSHGTGTDSSSRR